ncbi:MAG TPA: hypothetical protein VEB66_06550 [Opitutaceae bacterium]|nr:hypothetical protein [Opitutaceae bacterium]
MKFSRKDDMLDLGPYWRLDCRLAAELPEDNVVRARFLADALFGAIAFGLLLLCVWLGYANASLSGSIRDWEQRVAQSRVETDELQKLQQATSSLSNRLGRAAELAGSSYLVSQLLLDFGRTRPDQVRLDEIDMSEAVVYLRGNITESSDRATRLLGRYVEALRRDPAIGAHFAEITPSNIERVSNQNDAFSFEITLRKK